MEAFLFTLVVFGLLITMEVVIKEAPISIHGVQSTRVMLGVL